MARAATLMLLGSRRHTTAPTSSAGLLAWAMRSLSRAARGEEDAVYNSEIRPVSYPYRLFKSQTVRGQENVWNDLPLFFSIDETIPGMKDGEVVHILDVALFKICVDAELLAQEVQRIEGLGLGLSDGRNGVAARQLAEADKVTPGVLQKHSLRCRRGGRLMEQ